MTSEFTTQPSNTKEVMTMDHVVYLDTKANELEKLSKGSKTMIVRGAAGRKLPYGRVFAGDRLYFLNNDGQGMVRAMAKVNRVINSEKLSEVESAALLAENQAKLELSEAQSQRWSGKRYLVMVELENFLEIESFPIDKTDFGSMDDWLPVEDIEKVKLSNTE